MALEIELTNDTGKPLIHARGEVDLYASPALRDAILKAIPKAQGALGIELSQVEYMDSSGVATLVEGLKSANATKLEFILVAPSPSVMKVLHLARLDSVFTIVEQF
jgi:anti-sigma B factor antagonist